MFFTAKEKKKLNFISTKNGSPYFRINTTVAVIQTSFSYV